MHCSVWDTQPLGPVVVPSKPVLLSPLPRTTVRRGFSGPPASVGLWPWCPCSLPPLRIHLPCPLARPAPRRTSASPRGRTALRPSASAAPKDEKAAGPPEVGEERDLHPLLQFLPLDLCGFTQGSSSGMGPRGHFSRVPRPEICSLARSKLSRPPRCALHGCLQAGCTQRWGAAVLLPCSQAPEGQRLSLSRRSPPTLPQPTAWT